MYADITRANDYNAVTEWMGEMIREGLRDGMRMHASNDYFESLTGFRSVSIGYLGQYEVERYERGLYFLTGEGVNA